MNFINTSSVNNGIKTDAKKYIDLSENIYLSQIKEAAEKICADRGSKPIVLISGPSGSGKTTSALKIASVVKEKGIKVKTVSMDNYFLPSDMGELPVDENGNIDLEAPERLDIKLFSEDLKKISECQPIEIPVFDFTTQLRSGSIPMRREEDEIVIIEGIHALNPAVTGNAADDFSHRIYISVRTRVISNDNTTLHPSVIRLMRRLCRDRLFRGRKLPDVFEMFASVSRGEDLYIMPHKYRASMDIDTFIPYELSVYSALLLSDLVNVEGIMKDSENYRQTVKFLSEMPPLSDSAVPEASLIREFIGGGSF